MQKCAIDNTRQQYDEKTMYASHCLLHVTYFIEGRSYLPREAIWQSSTTPDPGHQTGKWQNTRKHYIQEKNQEVNHFPEGDQNIAMNKQGSLTDTKHK